MAVGNVFAILRNQVVLALDAGLHPVTFLLRLRQLALQGHPRRSLDFLAIHPQIAGDPADFGIPRQLDQAVGIRDREHVGMRGRHVEPGGEAGKTGAVLLHTLDRARRHQLGAQHAEQVDPADEEIFDLLGFGDRFEIFSHE